MGREGRVGLSGVRHVAYRAAWLYLCPWIVAVTLGSLPAAVRFTSIGVAAVAALYILAVLVKPRPTRASIDTHHVGHSE